MKESDYSGFNLPPELSRHAAIRQQQRGKTSRTLEIVYTHHDISLPATGQCMAVQISRRMKRELIAEGYAPQEIEAASRTTLILSSDEQIVTIYPGTSTRRFFNKRPAYTHRCTVDWKRRGIV